MDSNKRKNRDIKEIMLSIFPEIDSEALSDILNQPGDNTSLNDSSLNSDKNLIQISETILNTDDSRAINDYEASENPNKNTSKFEQHYKKNNSEKEHRYLCTVRKSVTTQNLPKMPSMTLVRKTNAMPSFLKKTFKSISSRFGAGADDMNKLKLSSFSKNDTIFALNVAGSVDSEYAFEIATKRFAPMNDNQKFIFAYIYSSPEQDKTHNYRNKKDIIMASYQNSMRSLDIDRFFFFGEEQNSKNYSHTIQQVEKLCDKHAASYMLTGFNSLKGPKGDNKLLEKGLQIMLKSQRTPFIVIKESSFQKPESSLEGLTWLFVFDKINTKCFNSFKKFVPLIDFSKDKVCGYTLIPNSNPFDDIEPLFLKEVSSRNIAKYEYDFQRYNDEAQLYANKKVNFGLTRYDFVVLYNNIFYTEFSKNIVEKQMISNMHIILGASSNICVMNGN